jgi:hypothetical protein
MASYYQLDVSGHGMGTPQKKLAVPRQKFDSWAIKCKVTSSHTSCHRDRSKKKK